MWKFTTGLLQKLQILGGPLRSFMQHIFERVSKDFLDKQPAFNVKNGILELQDLPLSPAKINKTFLVCSPYTLHSGVISKLRISLPNISELGTKHIEVYVEGVHLTFSPNKQFAINFNQFMKDLKQNLKFYDEEDENDNGRTIKVSSDDNNVDFIKQMLKLVLTNIRVCIKGIAVSLFMNTPSSAKKNEARNHPPKPQFFVLFRVPRITFQRIQQNASVSASSANLSSSVKNSTANTTENKNNALEKYRLQIPQVSAHLLRQDLKIPEYWNIKSDPSQFPLNYPSVSHPSVLFLLGSESQDNINNKGLQANISIDQLPKQNLKKIAVQLLIPSIESIVEPSQLRVLQNFADQVMEFSNIYSSSIRSLKLEDNDLVKKAGLEESSHYDLQTGHNRIANASFYGDDLLSTLTSSTMLGELELIRGVSGSRKQTTTSYMQRMIEDAKDDKGNSIIPQLKLLKEALPKQPVSNGLNQQPVTSLKLSAQLSRLNIYVLKYTSATAETEYQRLWLPLSPHQKINETIPCSYFMLKVKKITAEIQEQETAVINIKKIQLLNVKLHKQVSQKAKQQAPNSKNQPFVDEQSLQQSRHIQIPHKVDFLMQSSYGDSTIFHSFRDSNNNSLNNSIWQDEEMLKPNNSHPADLPRKKLMSFTRSPDQHYCINEIICIGRRNNKHSNSSHDKSWKKYCLLGSSAKGAPLKNNSQSAITIKSSTYKNTDQKVGKKISVDVKHIRAHLDLELLKDALNILYPVYTYGSLVQKLNLQRQHIVQEQQYLQSGQIPIPTLRRGPGLQYSRYQKFTESSEEEYRRRHEENENKGKKKAKPKPLMTLDVSTITVVFREVESFSHNLIQQYRQKRSDAESFTGSCFCSYSGQGLGMAIINLHVAKSSKIRVRMSDCSLGLYTMGSTKQSTVTAVLSLSGHRSQNVKLYFDDTPGDGSIVNHQILYLHTPKLSAKINRNTIVDLLRLAGSKTITQIRELQFFNSFLKQELISINAGIVSTNSLEDQACLLNRSAVPNLFKKSSSNGLNCSTNPNKAWTEQIGSEKHTTVSISVVDIESDFFGLLCKDIFFQIKPNRTLLGIQKILMYHIDDSVLLLKSSSRSTNLTQSYQHSFYDLEGFGLTGRTLESSKIVLLFDGQKKQESAAKIFQKKSSAADNVPAHLQYLQKIKYGIEITLAKMPVNKPMTKKSTLPPQSISNAVPMFKNRQTMNRLEVISEEDTIETLTVNIQNKITVRVCSIRHLLPITEFIENIQSEVKESGVDDLSSLGKAQRKDSEEVASREVKLVLNSKQIHLDVFPEFQVLENSKNIVMSNTRSSLVLSDIILSATLNRSQYQSNHISINVRLKQIGLYFLKFTDCGPDLSPLLISSEDLDVFGYKKICSVADLESDLRLIKSMRFNSDKCEILLSAKKLQINAAVSTIAYLQSHISHVADCFDNNLEKEKFVPPSSLKSQTNSIIVYEESDDDEEAVDVSELQQFIIKESEQSTHEQKHFEDTHVEVYERITYANPPKLEIKNLQLKELVLILTDGEDFDFIENIVDEVEFIELDDNNQVVKTTPQTKYKRLPNLKICNVTLLAKLGLNLQIRLYPSESSDSMIKVQFMQGQIKLRKRDSSEFEMLRLTRKLAVAIDIQTQKMKVKFGDLGAVIGFSSDLSVLVTARQKAMKQYNKSYFGPRGNKEKKNNSQTESSKENAAPTELFLIVPECLLQLNLQVIGCKFMSNQPLSVPSLFFHRKLSKYLQEDNKAEIKAWVKEIISSNLGSLIANGLVRLVSKSVTGVFGMIRGVIRVGPAKS